MFRDMASKSCSSDGTPPNISAKQPEEEQRPRWSDDLNHNGKLEAAVGQEIHPEAPKTYSLDGGMLHVGGADSVPDFGAAAHAAVGFLLQVHHAEHAAMLEENERLRNELLKLKASANGSAEASARKSSRRRSHKQQEGKGMQEDSRHSAARIKLVMEKARQPLHVDPVDVQNGCGLCQVSAYFDTKRCTYTEERMGNAGFDRSGTQVFEEAPTRATQGSMTPQTSKTSQDFVEAHLMRLARKDLNEENYDVSKYYYATGIAQKIARNDFFLNLTLAIIMLNILYIGYDSDKNEAVVLSEAAIEFQICTQFFCGFFTFEWLVRFAAFARKRDCLRDLWFKVDTGLVAMMIAETWLFPIILSGKGVDLQTGIFKLMRLLRLARMVRLMRALPELLAMIHGLKQAARAVLSSLALLSVLVYLFAVVMFISLKHQADLSKWFGTLGTTMSTLTLDGMLLDNVGLVARALMASEEWLQVCVFVSFVLLSALTVMNLLIGVLCEVVTNVAAREKEENQVKLVKDTLLVMLKHLDADGDGTLDDSEVAQVLHDEEAQGVLSSLGVDPYQLVDHLEMYYDTAPKVSVEMVLNLVMMLRGDCDPTIRNLLHELQFTRWKIAKVLKPEYLHMMERGSAVASFNGSTKTFSSQTLSAL